MTSAVFLLAALAISADAEENPEKLLQTFRKEFIPITPGTGKFPRSFEMGTEQESTAERPVHRVTFERPFAVAKFEVPQNLWSAVMGSNPSRWKGPRNSVEMVSHDDAVTFCRRATEQMRTAQLIGPDEEIRLPTEAEWEYVARAGTSGRYSFGDDPDQLDDYGWYQGNAAGNDPPVGDKKPNPWGLYDVHGYLWEWCQDSQHADYQGAPTDGSARLHPPDDDSPRARVIRGGSWKDPAEQLTSTCRHGKLPHTDAQGKKRVVEFSGGIDASIRDDAIGLRCILARVIP